MCYNYINETERMVIKMNMDEIIKNLTDEELRKCYEQCLILNNTGMIADQPLRGLIDDCNKNGSCMGVPIVFNSVMVECSGRWYNM